MYKVELEALDGKPITERTGKAKVTGVAASKPIPRWNFIVMYDKDQAEHPTDPSPGVAVASEIVEHIGNEYRITDVDGRTFRAILNKENTNG